MAGPAYNEQECRTCIFQGLGEGKRSRNVGFASNPARRKLRPPSKGYLLANRRRAGAFRRHPLANFVQPHADPRQQSAAHFLRGSFCGYLPVVRSIDVRLGTQSVEAVRRKASRRFRFEASHAPRGRWITLVIPASHHDVLVRLRPNEPLDRQVVLATRRGGASGYGCHGCHDFELCLSERERGGICDCVVSRDGARLLGTQFLVSRKRVSASRTDLGRRLRVRHRRWKRRSQFWRTCSLASFAGKASPSASAREFAGALYVG